MSIRSIFKRLIFFRFSSTYGHCNIFSQHSYVNKRKCCFNNLLKCTYFSTKTEQMEAEAAAIKVLETPLKSPHDKKEYRVVQLQNGLTALLISDLASLKPNPFQSSAASSVESDDESTSGEENGEDETEDDEDREEESEEDEGMVEGEDQETPHSKRETRYFSAASLTIGAGSFEDEEIQGVMHFLEHMVFMGSKKYPQENYFDNFIKKCGGCDNAHTDYESTTFYFEVQEAFLESALDTFAQFFISPLMKEDAMQRERKAVHSEFEEAQTDDDCRKQQLLAMLATEGHPMGSFAYGNDDTLRHDVNDMELHKKLHELRSRFYSGHYMTLAVQGRESLDSLQQMVAAIFSQIPTNRLPKVDRSAVPFPFPVASLHRLLRVVPVSDVHTLDVSWALDSLQNHYRARPLHYIAHLIGHEGFGSIISYLKKRVWAVDVYCGNDESGFEHNTTYALFHLRLHLTENGLKHLHDVLRVIFEYLLLIRRGVDERIFREIQAMEKCAFDYAEEEGSTASNVQRRSENMQLYPPCHYLTGDTVIYDYEPELIKSCIEKLKPNTCNIMISSKEFESQADLNWQQEKWFGTKYCIEDMPKEWVSEWESSVPNPELRLPDSNPFIPDDFRVLCTQDSPDAEKIPKYPISLHEDLAGELWFRQDSKFCLPRAYCYIYHFTELVHQSAEMAAMLDLCVTLFKQHVMEAMYPACMAQYEISFESADMGIVIKINGWDQKLHKCVELILSKMMDFEENLDDKTFDQIKQQQIKSYHNAMLSPDVLRRDTRLCLIQASHWPVARKMQALPPITKEHFLTYFWRPVMAAKYVKMLVQGNMTDNDAKKLYFLVNPDEKVFIKCPKMRARRCRAGAWHVRVPSVNRSSVNSSVINYYQGEAGSLKHELINEFIVMAMDEPVFDTLRTKEQLGYHVDCTNRNTHGVVAISVTVNSQANKFSVTHIDCRIEAFLRAFSAQLRASSDDEVAALKTTLANYKLAVDLTLKEEMDRNWEEILAGEYLFSRREKHLELIPSVTREGAADYLDRLTAKPSEAGDECSYRKISVQVVGPETPEMQTAPGHEHTLGLPASEVCRCEGATEADVAAGLSSDVFISDVEQFAQSLTLFSPAVRQCSD